jgi:hypothetical protein
VCRDSPVHAGPVRAYVKIRPWREAEALSAGVTAHSARGGRRRRNVAAANSRNCRHGDCSERDTSLERQIARAQEKSRPHLGIGNARAHEER